VDVNSEITKIDNVENIAEYSLLIKHLVKSYPPSIFGGKAKLAVRDISFGVQNGERFGLLGINGAGH
jgi:ABC-type Na+ transport system ATPase subunit NatA